MAEIVRLLVLIVVVLPLALLLSGPSLVLAALRGRQRVGPIVLNPGQRGRFGRVWACLLGLLLWLAVWGGVALLLGRTLRPTTVAHVPPPTPVAVSPLESPHVHKGILALSLSVMLLCLTLPRGPFLSSLA